MEEQEKTKKLQNVSQSTSLTPKNRLFLQLICEGRTTLQAYNEAGYKGNEHAAYTLKTRLNGALAEAAEARGITKADLLVDMLKLKNLPLVHRDRNGNELPLTGITIHEKLKLMQLHKDLLPTSKPTSITALVINRFGEKSVEAIKPESIIDASVEESKDNTGM